MPVIGANVVEKGTTNGTITDAEGRFSLNVASDATLVITYIGYVTSEIPVIGKNSVTITLREDTEVLDEVIVVGTDGDKHFTFDDMAAILGTINYELPCVLTKRVPRVYKENGEIVGIVDHVLHQYR